MIANTTAEPICDFFDDRQPDLMRVYRFSLDVPPLGIGLVSATLGVIYARGKSDME